MCFLFLQSLHWEFECEFSQIHLEIGLILKFHFYKVVRLWPDQATVQRGRRLELRTGLHLWRRQAAVGLKVKMHCDLPLRWRICVSLGSIFDHPSTVHSQMQCESRCRKAPCWCFRCQHRWFYLEPGRMPFAIHAPSIFQNRVSLCQKQTRTTHLLAPKVASLQERLICAQIQEGLNL